jgi:hypothetical protein
VAEDAVTTGFHARTGVGCRNRQSQFQKPTPGCRARRHPVLETKIIQRADNSSGESMTCKRLPRASFMETAQNEPIE